MTAFKLKSLPIYNRTEGELDLGLEPEGDIITLPPGAECEVQVASGVDVDDLELECGEGRLTVHASCRKAVVVNGVRVR